MDGFKQFVSIVVPAYNEEEVIEKCVETIFLGVKEFGLENFEVIVVDDGSSDNTFVILEKLMKKYSSLRVIKHETNFGYGKALKSGFDFVKGSLIFYTDADLQFDITELSLLLNKLYKADIVIGYRVKRKDAGHRLFLSSAYNWFVNKLFGLNFRDVDCGFKLFKKEVFDKVEIESKGFIVDLEILAKAKKHGFLIVEVPVSHYKRFSGSSKVTLRLVLKTVCDTFWLWIKIRKTIKKIKGGD